MRKRGERFWRATLFSLLGPLLWALHFGAVYGGQHVACAAETGLSFQLIRTGIISATAVVAAPLLFASIAPRRTLKIFGLCGYDEPMRCFLAGTMRLLSLLSFFGVVWAGSAALFLDACPALR